MQITVLAGGVGAARFLTGLMSYLTSEEGQASFPQVHVTVIGNTADDITLHGLRVCPDLDTVMYTLGGGIHPEQGWGRNNETFSVSEELAAYGASPDWFTLGDRDIATHIVRTRMLNMGRTLSETTAHLCARWRPGVTLLPMTDDRVETHVTIEDQLADGGLRAIHFQQWWVGMKAEPKPYAIHAVGLVDATPAPGVIESIEQADVILLPPSNPVVSIGTILGVPGIRQALTDAKAPVVGVSPVIAGRAVRGMAEQCLGTLNLPATASAVAGLYADFLSGWLIATEDSESAAEITGHHPNLEVLPRELLMDSDENTAAIAQATLELALKQRA